MLTPSRRLSQLPFSLEPMDSLNRHEDYGLASLDETMPNVFTFGFES